MKHENIFVTNLYFCSKASLKFLDSLMKILFKIGESQFQQEITLQLHEDYPVVIDTRA